MPSASFTCRAHFAVRETLAMRVHGSVSPTKQRQPRLGGDGPRNRNLSKYSMLHFHLIPTDHLTAYLLTLCRPPRLYAAAAALLSVSLSPPPPIAPALQPIEPARAAAFAIAPPSHPPVCHNKAPWLRGSLQCHIPTLSLFLARLPVEELGHTGFRHQSRLPFCLLLDPATILPNKYRTCG